MQMGEYLSCHVGEGDMKDKLHDQLIWLKYQINYYSKAQNLEILEENFNWVVSNFNHDLHVNSHQEFKKKSIRDRN